MHWTLCRIYHSVQAPWPYMRCISVLTSAPCSPPTTSRQQCGHEQGSQKAQKCLPAGPPPLGLEGPPGGISCPNTCSPLLCTDWHLCSEYMWVWVCMCVGVCVCVWVCGCGGVLDGLQLHVSISMGTLSQSAGHMPKVTSHHMIGACATASWSMGVEFGFC